MQPRRKLFSAANARWWPPNPVYFYLSLRMILFDQMLPTSPLMLSVVCRFHSVVWLPQFAVFVSLCIPTLTSNNKDISTSESAIPRNGAITGKLQLVDSVFWPPSWIFSRNQLPVMMHRPSGVVIGGRRGGRPERHLLRGRQIERIVKKYVV